MSWNFGSYSSRVSSYLPPSLESGDAFLTAILRASPTWLPVGLFLVLSGLGWSLSASTISAVAVLVLLVIWDGVCLLASSGRKCWSPSKAQRDLSYVSRSGRKKTREARTFAYRAIPWVILLIGILSVTVLRNTSKFDQNATWIIGIDHIHACDADRPALPDWVQKIKDRENK